MMKKLMSLIVALVLLFSMSAAMADPSAIDGLTKRQIKINEAGLNPSADEMISQMISPRCLSADYGSDLQCRRRCDF